ncbi:11253_t:CDS:1, partial [Paraglomus brasilianum]
GPMTINLVQIGLMDRSGQNKYNIILNIQRTLTTRFIDQEAMEKFERTSTHILR